MKKRLNAALYSQYTTGCIDGRIAAGKQTFFGKVMATLGVCVIILQIMHGPETRRGGVWLSI